MASGGSLEKNSDSEAAVRRFGRRSEKMDKIVQGLVDANEHVNALVWGAPMLVLIISTGIYMTVRTGFFQVTRLKDWLGQTLFAIFKRKGVRTSSDHKAISQFQALATSMAATIGTGNIAGVATAITIGGPGAIFWMWVSAFFGMMTDFSENVLGIFYRRRNEEGEWSGGAMYYLRDGLKGKKFIGKLAKPLSYAFAAFCVLASFGIGNMTQINNIATSLKNAFEPAFGFQIPPHITGIVLCVIVGMVVIGGIQRIGKVTEKLVPLMALMYILGTLVIFLMNYEKIPAVFGSIFKGAFGLTPITGGISGALIKNAVSMGFKRGVFSNEAGLGSSVMVNCASDVKEPVVEGMWGICGVFIDTMIVCTLTAFSILSTGVVDLDTGKVLTDLEGTQLVTYAFSSTIHGGAGIFVAVATLFFAFSTVIGWSFYGTKSVEYLFGTKGIYVYKVLFVSFIFIGATMKLELAWSIADTLNGLMAIPNLIGVICLSSTVIAITKNYLARRNKSSRLKPRPMLSAFEEIQREQERCTAQDDIGCEEEQFFKK